MTNGGNSRALLGFLSRDPHLLRLLLFVARGISEEQLAALVDRRSGTGGETPIIAAGRASVLDQHIAKVAKLNAKRSKTAQARVLAR